MLKVGSHDVSCGLGRQSNNPYMAQCILLAPGVRPRDFIEKAAREVHSEAEPSYMKSDLRLNYNPQHVTHIKLGSQVI